MNARSCHFYRLLQIIFWNTVVDVKWQVYIICTKKNKVQNRRTSVPRHARVISNLSHEKFLMVVIVQPLNYSLCALLFLRSVYNFEVWIFPTCGAYVRDNNSNLLKHWVALWYFFLDNYISKRRKCRVAVQKPKIAIYIMHRFLAHFPSNLYYLTLIKWPQKTTI